MDWPVASALGAIRAVLKRRPYFLQRRFQALLSAGAPLLMVGCVPSRLAQAPNASALLADGPVGIVVLLAAIVILALAARTFH